MLSWLYAAQRELGNKEVDGSGSNPRILEYAKSTPEPMHDDSVVPWCAIFVSWVLESVGIKSTKSAWSLSYLDWGVPLSGPRIGAVAVLSRGSNPNQGHVGFVSAFNLLTVTLLAGNQNNMVCYETFPRWRVKAYRWPKTMNPQGSPVVA